MATWGMRYRRANHGAGISPEEDSARVLPVPEKRGAIATATSGIAADEEAGISAEAAGRIAVRSRAAPATTTIQIGKAGRVGRAARAARAECPADNRETISSIGRTRARIDKGVETGRITERGIRIETVPVKTVRVKIDPVKTVAGGTDPEDRATIRSAGAIRVDHGDSTGRAEVIERTAVPIAERRTSSASWRRSSISSPPSIRSRDSSWRPSRRR